MLRFLRNRGQRTRQAIRTSAFLGLARAVRIGTSFIAVRITLPYLGTEMYGLWLTITSLAALFAFADLGLGNGLVTSIAEAYGSRDLDRQRRLVSSAFFALLAVAVIGSIGFAIAYPSISWERVFNVHTDAAIRSVGPAAAVFIAFLLINLPLSAVQRLQFGLQEGDRSALWDAIGSVLGLAGLLTAIHLTLDLPRLVFAYTLGPTLALLMNSAVVFGGRHSALRPRFLHLEVATSFNLLRLGGMFFAVQIAMALAFYSDSIIIAHKLSAGAVPMYAVPAKLYDAVSMVMSIFLAPLWPAYGEAIARGDLRWVKKVLVTSLLATGGICGLAAVTLGVLANTLLRWWVGPSIVATPILLVGLGLWLVLSNMGSAVAMLLNGSGRVRIQFQLALALGVGTPVLKLLFIPYVGVAGVVWGTVAAYCLITVGTMVFYVPGLLRSLEDRMSRSFAPPLAPEESPT